MKVPNPYTRPSSPFSQPLECSRCEARVVPVIRILIVDNTRIYREGLAQILEREPEIDVVATAANLEETLSHLDEQRPEVLLFHMTESESIPLLSGLAETTPSLRMVALGVSETEDEIIACAEAGVAGYVPRDGSLHDLVATINGVARGEVRYSPRIVAPLLRRVATLAAERQPRTTLVHLTPREREIGQLIGTGLSNKEIARHLSIEVRTVKNHVHNILEKGHVHRRGEAAALNMGRQPAVRMVGI